MDIFVNVTGQKLRLAANQKNYISGTQEFIRFVFNLTEDWNGLTIFAQFRQGDAAYNKYLDENNSTFLPRQINSGECTVILYGNRDKTIAITDYITLYIADNILITDAQSTEITESLYNQLADKVKQLEENGISYEKINEIISEYLEDHPIGGMTDDERKQLQKNTEDIALLLHKCPTVTLQLSISVSEIGSNRQVLVSATSSDPVKDMIFFSDNTQLQQDISFNGTRGEVIVPDITSTTTFKVTATDDMNHKISSSKTIYFYNGIYTGVGDENTDFGGLSKSLQSNRTKTFTVNAGDGEYIWYACPSSMGTPTFYVGSLLPGGFEKVTETNFVNTYGHSETYQVWRSVHDGLGIMQVEVK